MSVVTLAEMTDAEFARRRAPMIKQYARATADAGGMTVQEAEAMAEKETAADLADGPRSAGQLLRTAWADGQEVGWIWIAMPGKVGPDLAWICEILVDEPHRSHGYAAAMITRIEEELTELGVPRLGLNVFAYNKVAQRLYERLGFAPIQWQYARSLFDVPATVSSPVTLRPIEIASCVPPYAEAMAADYPTLTAAEVDERVQRQAGAEGAHACRLVADGVEIGWALYTQRHVVRHGMGWISRLQLAPAYRGKGLGPAAVAAIEADLAARGVGSVGLAVPGSLPGVRELVERLGFELTAQQMEKKLPAL